MSSALKPFVALLQAIPEPTPQYVGVYFLFDKEEIVYVGQSANVPSRIAAHRTKRNTWVDFVWDRAAWLPVAEDDLSAYEGALIRRLTPRYNTSTPADTSRDREICDSLNLPACDIAKLAEFLERRQWSFADPSGEKAAFRAKRKQARVRCEKEFGVWIDHPWARARRYSARYLWRAVKPLLTSNGAS